MIKLDDVPVIHGTVKLEEGSLRELEKKIREDVLSDLEKEGLYLVEVKRFMNQIEPITFYHLLSEYLQPALNRTRVDLHPMDEKKIEKMRAIANILSL